MVNREIKQLVGRRPGREREALQAEHAKNNTSRRLVQSEKSHCSRDLEVMKVGNVGGSRRDGVEPLAQGGY